MGKLWQLAKKMAKHKFNHANSVRCLKPKDERTVDSLRGEAATNMLVTKQKERSGFWPRHSSGYMPPNQRGLKRYDIEHLKLRKKD